MPKMPAMWEKRGAAEQLQERMKMAWRCRIRRQKGASISLLSCVISVSVSQIAIFQSWLMLMKHCHYIPHKSEFLSFSTGFIIHQLECDSQPHLVRIYIRLIHLPTHFKLNLTLKCLRTVPTDKGDVQCSLFFFFFKFCSLSERNDNGMAV